MRRLWAPALAIFLLVFSGCTGSPKPISIAVSSPTGAQALDLGQSFTISVQVDNDPLAKGATFTLNGVGALANQSVSGATYNAPTTGAGGTATITIASASNPAITQTIMVTVSPLPQISNASSTLAAAVKGTAYNASITTTGGAGALSYSVTVGTLPPGLSINSSSGAITGTPTATGTSTFTVQVKDSSTGAPQTSSKSFTITVNEQPTITSANTTSFVAGTSGTFSVTTTAIPTAALAESGALPTGITFVDNGNGTATLSGTTSTTGSFPITITATNGVGTPASQNFTLIVGKAPAINSVNATTFTVGSAGTFSVTTTGFPAPSLTETGALPSGVTFKDNGNGTATLAGTPAAGTGGTFSITIKAHNGIGADASQSFVLTVDQAPAISSAASSTFTINTLGAFTVTTTGFPSAALSEVGTLPTGVTFVDNHNGTATLSGTATASGTFPFTITANNGITPNATQSFILTVGQSPAITSGAATTFTVGSSGTFSVTTTGFPAPSLTETGALPSGVSLVDNGNGTATLAGTPAAGTGGTFSITIKTHNGIGADASQSFVLTVDQAPAITSAATATFSVGALGTFTVTTTGFPSAALSEVGALPTGVTFVDNHNGTATLSGTASASGTFPITITANNGITPNATQSFTLTVNTAPAFTSANNTVFTVGSSGTFTISATGTPKPSFTQTGSLPSGVTFHDNGDGTATLAGTPAANSGGVFTLTITATNSAGSTNQTFTLTVNQAPAITSAASFTFTVGANSSFTVTTTGVPKPALSETGALPSGVTFVDNGNGTATLSGTPASGTAGSFPITITANNGVTPNATQSFTLTVDTAPVFSSANSTTFPVGSSGNFTVTATGAVSFTETGALPSGVTFHDNGNGTATLAGTPAANTGGTYTITINAKNGAGTTTQSFTLTVTEAPAFTSNDTTTFDIGQLSSFNVNASGFPSPTISESGALPTGVTFNTLNNTLSGTPATGTAGSYPITFTATNGIGTGATLSFTLVVVLDPCAGAATGSEALLNGQYAFVLKGFDNGAGAGETAPQPALVGGVLTFNGSGSITAGTLDQNLNSTAGILSLAVSSGTYAVGPDHRACLSIVTSQGTQHYRASLAGISAGVASIGHMIDFDTSGPFTAGTLRKQTPAAFGTASGQFTGNYAFGVASSQNTATSNNGISGGSFGAVGVFNLSGGNVTGGEVDFNANGKLDGSSAVTWPASAVPILSGGTYSVSSTTGRGSFLFTPTGSPAAVVTVIYVVSASDVLILDGDNQTTNTVFAGELIQQSTSSFSANPLSGSYIGYDSGLDAAGGPSRADFFLTGPFTTGNNTLSGFQFRNDGGVFSSFGISGTYAVSPAGRETVATTGNHQPILYLSSPSQAFFLNSNGAVDFGMVQSQTGGPFSNSSVTGSFAFGDIDLQSSSNGGNSGVATFATPNVTVTADSNTSGSQTAGQINTTTFSLDSNTGLISLPSGCTFTATTTTCNTLIYIISPSKSVVLDPGTSSPKIQIADK